MLLSNLKVGLRALRVRWHIMRNLEMNYLPQSSVKYKFTLARFKISTKVSTTSLDIPFLDFFKMAESQVNCEPLFALLPAEQTSPLWHLPLEIREMIYAHILPPSATIIPDVGEHFEVVKVLESGKLLFRSHETILGLARTCQTLYTDLVPFYYSNKTFSFESTYDFYQYLYMIGSYRRQLVQKIEFRLWAGFFNLEEMTTKTEKIYEWTCGMLRECISLRKLGIGVCEQTKDGIGEGPVKGLESLRGMGLKNLEVRVREVYYCWPKKCCHGDYSSSVWDIQLVRQEQPKRFELAYFKPEAVSALEKRLLRDMQADQGDNGEGENPTTEDITPGLHKGANCSRSAPNKAGGKRAASSKTGIRRKKRVNVGAAKRGNGSIKE
jgi:hypothetical protein